MNENHKDENGHKDKKKPRLFQSVAPSNGTIAAINLEKPPYLDSNDLLLQGDLVKLLPHL